MIGNTTVRRRAARRLLAVTIAILAALFTSEPAARAAGLGPRFTVDSTAYDFGTVEPGAVVHHAFSFRNTGDADLHIDGVDAECGCTAATVSGTTISPGREGSVSVYFDTRSFRGKKTKRVRVSTNDPTARKRDLILTGVVLPSLLADPPKLYLGRIRPGTTRMSALRITRPTAEPVVLAAASADSSAIAVSMEQAAQGDGSHGVLSVGVARDTPLRGSFDATLRITTADRPPRILEVPVFGTIEGDLDVQPTHIDLRPGRRASRRARRLRVRNSGAAPVFIDQVQVAGVSLDRLDYTVRALRTGYDYRIVLRFGRSRVAADGGGAVRIYTTHPVESEIVVPLYMPARSRGTMAPVPR